MGHDHITAEGVPLPAQASGLDRCIYFRSLRYGGGSLFMHRTEIPPGYVTDRHHKRVARAIV